MPASERKWDANAQRDLCLAVILTSHNGRSHNWAQIHSLMDKMGYSFTKDAIWSDSSFSSSFLPVQWGVLTQLPASTSQRSSSRTSGCVIRTWSLRWRRPRNAEAHPPPRVVPGAMGMALPALPRLPALLPPPARRARLQLRLETGMPLMSRTRPLLAGSEVVACCFRSLFARCSPWRGLKLWAPVFSFSSIVFFFL